jgi:hypothetical protein
MHSDNLIAQLNEWQAIKLNSHIILVYNIAKNPSIWWASSLKVSSKQASFDDGHATLSTRPHCDGGDMVGGLNKALARYRTTCMQISSNSRA